jgi:hypothetical protein
MLPEVKVLYSRLKASAKKRGIEFSLKLTDMYHIDYPLTCPILNIPMKFNTGSAEDNSYSVDRIDSAKGYSIDNIIVISNKANRIKNNATNEELSKLSRFYEQLTG